MENLISDCLPPIFSYLSLSDLLHLRSVSRRYKQEVDDHLPSVRSLPLYLITPINSGWIAHFEQIIRSNQHFKLIPKLSDQLYIRRLRFGTSGQRTFEDGTILQNQNHFRLADFLIINDRSKLPTCLQFFQKHCPNIEKLALVLDDREHYLPEVNNFLRAFPGIKVLLMESTLKDMCLFPDNSPIDSSTLEKLQNYDRNRVKLPPEVYNSILAMNNLQELYFFSRRQSQLSWEYKETVILNFVKNILRQLRVFHYNTYIREPFHLKMFKLPVTESIDGMSYMVVYSRLEELACSSVQWSFRSKLLQTFPALKKLIFLDYPHLQHPLFWDYSSFVFPPYTGLPEIKHLDFTMNEITVSTNTIENLNFFPLLERLHCRQLFIGPQVWNRELLKETLEHCPTNWTIKHLEVISGPGAAEDRKRDVRRYSEYFRALEICVFLEPEYSEILVSDL